ncbi:rab11 family-interacting protein 4A-like isoform X2 [Asterias amurensis]|uniref:rab11 family-interacting protein 4A-like isoform X2 n=1 Tax=Asterias amurensis TaxID=7602 RepID=UPI003AB435F7
MASDRHLRTVFEALDEGNLGYITADRFADLAKDFGVHDQDELGRLLGLLDPAHTGEINYNSFCQGIQAVATEPTVKAQVRSCDSPLLWSDGKTKIDDDDTHSNGTSESTFNEYDDSALTDMSEDNTSPLLYDGYSPAIDGDDTDSAIAVPSVNMNGYFSSDGLRVPKLVDDNATSSLPSDEEQRFEDFGQNPTCIDLEVQDVASLSDSADTVERQTPTSTLNGPVRRISSKEFANHLYRSSSSHNLPNKGGAMEDAYGEYAASDTDVLELNDKVLELESQLTVLEQDQVSRAGQQGRLKSDKIMLMHQVQSLEEQLREAEMRHQESVEDRVKRHKDQLSKNEKEMEEQIELLSNRILFLDQEKCQHETDMDRLKLHMENLKQENSRLEAQVLDLDNKWLALSVDYQQKQDIHHREMKDMEETIKASNVLVDDLSLELEALRHENLEQREYGARLMRSPSVSDLPSRYSEIKDEVKRLKKENANLKDTNEEMSAQLLNNSVQIGRSLLHRGTSKSESFASELEKSSKDDIMQALREEEQLNRDLREYIGRILSRILDSNPGLLEIRPKRHGSVASLMSMDT